MDFLMKAYEWLMADGAMYFAVLLGVSEALAMIPALKANSIFQMVVGALAWAKDKMPKKK